MTPGRLPRGIRNHNPGNIRRTGTLWRGMAADQSGDAAFAVFQEPLWGLRALGRLLRTYYDVHRCRSVAAIIGRYAPPSENDTAAYVAAVAAHLRVAPEATLPRDLPTWVGLMQAIVRHENGVGDYYPPALYRSAAELALDLSPSLQKESFMQYLFSRLQERSTWIGLIALVTGFGVSVGPEISNAIITIGSTLAGVIAALTPDRPS